MGHPAPGLGGTNPTGVLYQRTLVPCDGHNEPTCILHRDIRTWSYWRCLGDGAVREQCLQLAECGDLNRHRGQSRSTRWICRGPRALLRTSSGTKSIAPFMRAHVVLIRRSTLPWLPAQCIRILLWRTVRPTVT